MICSRKKQQAGKKLTIWTGAKSQKSSRTLALEAWGFLSTEVA